MDTLDTELFEGQVLDTIVESIHREQECHLRQWRQRARKRVALVLAVLLAVSGITAFFVGGIRVEGRSMEPTLWAGDIVLYLRCAGYAAQDIVVFRQGSGEMLVKRVVAVGGDVVDVEPLTGRISVNGAALDEPYAANEGHHMDSATFPLTVPPEELFVLGDNRDVSLDSRNKEIGTIPLRTVSGRALSVLRASL